MQSKRAKLLLLILLISVSYSWLSFFVFENIISDDLEYGLKSNLNTLEKERIPASLTGTKADYVKPTATLSDQSQAHVSEANATSLPVTFFLLGTSLKTSDEPARALIEFEGDLISFEENDLMLNLPMRLIAVNNSSVEIEYEEQLVRVTLIPPNLLAPNYKQREKSMTTLLQMTATEIGLRPRIIEHIVTTSYTPYFADGQLVSPGINPALFEAAGFHLDDLLKTVNNKSVTIEHELELIQQEMQTAHTLKFTVLRRGRMITLYLDIPSEGLKISAQ